MPSYFNKKKSLPNYNVNSEAPEPKIVKPVAADLAFISQAVPAMLGRKRPGFFQVPYNLSVGSPTALFAKAVVEFLDVASAELDRNLIRKTIASLADIYNHDEAVRSVILSPTISPAKNIMLMHLIQSLYESAYALKSLSAEKDLDLLRREHTILEQGNAVRVPKPIRGDAEKMYAYINDNLKDDAELAAMGAEVFFRSYMNDHLQDLQVLVPYANLSMLLAKVLYKLGEKFANQNIEVPGVSSNVVGNIFIAKAAQLNSVEAKKWIAKQGEAVASSAVIPRAP